MTKLLAQYRVTSYGRGIVGKNVERSVLVYESLVPIDGMIHLAPVSGCQKTCWHDDSGSIKGHLLEIGHLVLGE